jgi:hypothetical protein
VVAELVDLEEEALEVVEPEVNGKNLKFNRAY